MNAAPRYAGEGPHALWHVSEDPTLRRFEPHLRPGHDADEPLVWAVDTRHLPLYWFPRDCPRATFWAHERTTDDDVERFLDGDRERRVHVIESDSLERMRTTRVYAYRMPAATFERHDRFWVSRSAVDPIDLTDADYVDQIVRSLINLILSFSLSNISVGGHIGGLIGGILCALVLSRFGRGHAAYTRVGLWGVAGLCGVGLLSLAVAYLKVRGYAQ